MVGRFWLGSSVSSGGGEWVVFINNDLFLGISSCFEGFGGIDVQAHICLSVVMFNTTCCSIRSHTFNVCQE